MSTVLIVDDSKTSRFMLKRILEANGYEVVGEAENGQDGYDKYCQLMPDFVTLDITMPIMDGIETLVKIKEFELLTYFIENKGIALSREKILNSVWNYDYFGDARTIDTHVKKLRSKMGNKGDLIKTVWGMGYKLEV